MFNKISEVLDNENGFFNPVIFTQLPSLVIITNIFIYMAIFGSDFYMKPEGLLLK